MSARGSTNVRISYFVNTGEDLDNFELVINFTSTCEIERVFQLNKNVMLTFLDLRPKVVWLLTPRVSGLLKIWVGFYRLVAKGGFNGDGKYQF